MMQLHLAPMEGVLDHHMRALLTAMGGYSHCSTEFIRVIDRLLPPRLYYRYSPELRHGGRTAAGTPVVVQLLGGIPEVMAMNGEQAARLGAPAIDINFGCPSRFVNRKAGGAVLLKEPSRVHEITRAVRNAVPAEVPVSAKIRLGYEDTALALENALAVQEAGASQITVHARTKADGYKYPARWEWLARIRETVTIPMIANGDIKSIEDYRRCRAISGCDDIMIGRGALASPGLARAIQAERMGVAPTATPWQTIVPLLLQLSETLKESDIAQGRYIGARLKQWLNYLRGGYPEAQHCFEQVRSLKRPEEILEILHRQGGLPYDGAPLPSPLKSPP